MSKTEWIKDYCQKTGCDWRTAMQAWEDAWHPIEDAPLDTPVRVGGYDDMGGKLWWKTDVRVVRRTIPENIFRRSRVVFDRGYVFEYTHFKLLPEPPNE
jgi:hypothetical protein